jgi:C_GCAxxG_C_C family probable redox protein
MHAADTAEARFRQGYSCSQAVFSALGELWGVPLPLSLRIGAGFGGGMARTAGVCGAVTGALMGLGLAQSSVSPEENPTEREKTYARCRRFLERFAERHGSVVCRDLLGCDISTPEGLAEAHQRKLTRTVCPPFVRDAVQIALELLEEEGITPHVWTPADTPAPRPAN